MIQLLSRMARLPVAIFVASFEVALRVMREFQHGFNQGMEVMAGGAAPMVQETIQTLQAVTGATSSDPGKSEPTTDTTEKERLDMVDQDLSGDDLKLVRYRILYIKRDQ